MMAMVGCKKTIEAIAATAGRQKTAKRAQVAMEVMVYLGFFMLVFVFVLLFMLPGFNADVNKREFIFARETAGQIADYSQFIIKAGPGYWANFTMAQKINGREYNATFVSSGWLYIDLADSDGMGFAYPLAVSNIRAGPGAEEKVYSDTDGIIRYAAVVRSHKGWIAFNYTDTPNGPVILVN